jgi:hypothetical protein
MAPADKYRDRNKYQSIIAENPPVLNPGLTSKVKSPWSNANTLEKDKLSFSNPKRNAT